MLRSLLCCGLLLAALLCSGQHASAHESRPAFFEISEAAAGRYQVEWKVPASVRLDSLPELVMPESCIALSAPLKQQRAGAYLGQQLYRCDSGLSGEELRVRYPLYNPSISTLLRVRLLNNVLHSRVLKPGVTHWTVPETEDAWGVMKDYTWLGMMHIWKGLDHLLFVACLMFIAGSTRRILITVTGFTLAHSLTLILAALQIVSLPVVPVEAVIALSILFLAHEIVIDNRQSWTFRYPIAVSSSFGLLHGFGFAAVLRDLGLPQTEQTAALLCFNLGVELGQVLFVLLAGTLLWLWKRGAATDRKRMSVYPGQTLVVYLIGILVSYWLIERVAAFWA